MKNNSKILLLGCILSIGLTTQIHAQNSTKSSNFRGQIDGLSFTATMNYKAQRFQINPFISASISNVKIQSFSYEGITYSGNDLIGINFPIDIKDGYLSVEATFQFGNNSKLQTRATMIDINSNISSDRLVNSFMDDRFYWKNDEDIKRILKANGVEDLDTWGQKLGRMVHASIKDGSLDGIQRELIQAVERTNDAAMYTDLMSDGNAALRAKNYVQAKSFFSKAKKYADDPSIPQSKIDEAQELHDSALKLERFNDLLDSAEDAYSKRNFKNALVDFKQALHIATSSQDTYEIKQRISDTQEKLKDQQEAQDRKQEEAQAFREQLERDKEAAAEARKMLNEFEQKKIDKEKEKQIQDDLDYYEGRRNTQKLMERERQRNLDQAQRSAEQFFGSVFTSGINSLMEGNGYLRFSYAYRTLSPPYEKATAYPASINSFEVAAGFGKMGIFVGGGYPGDWRFDRGFNIGYGYLANIGLELALLKSWRGFSLGINGEYGIGNIEKHRVVDNDYSSYPSSFYSFGVNAVLFRWVFLSYNYGWFNTEKMTHLEGEPAYISGTLEHTFSKINLGIMFDFGY